jgi:hypothetical protein
MARVFTVYNCGTGFNRERSEEAIANLASRTEGSENREWMICDGPGSAPKKPHSQARTPGLHDPKTGFKTSAPTFAKLKGVTEGYGWEHNVQHAMEVIKALIAGSNTPPSVVNMAGWSRGAITCHMLAHALAKEPMTTGIAVNIFAFDPVPGPDNFQAEKVSLPSNVQHYTAVVAEDEARSIMRPVMFAHGPEDAKHFKTIPLPGAHNTAVMRLKTEVGTIGAALAHRFLTKHGTLLRDPFLLTDVQFCELYAKVRLDIRTFRGMKGSSMQRKLLGVFNRGAKNDFNDSAYFVNEHHARQFQHAFPGMWRLMNHGAQLPGEVDREAAAIRMRAPTTYKSLVETGILA